MSAFNPVKRILKYVQHKIYSQYIQLRMKQNAMHGCLYKECPFYFQNGFLTRNLSSAPQFLYNFTAVHSQGLSIIARVYSISDELSSVMLAVLDTFPYLALDQFFAVQLIYGPFGVFWFFESHKTETTRLPVIFAHNLCHMRNLAFKLWYKHMKYIYSLRD
jgi:hypothetical protein